MTTRTATATRRGALGVQLFRPRSGLTPPGAAYVERARQLGAGDVWPCDDPPGSTVARNIVAPTVPLDGYGFTFGADGPFPDVTAATLTGAAQGTLRSSYWTQVRDLNTWTWSAWWHVTSSRVIHVYGGGPYVFDMNENRLLSMWATSTGFTMSPGWHHCAVTLTGGEAVGYVDGVAIATRSVAALTRPPISNTAVASHAGPGQSPADSGVALVAMFDRALTAGEVGHLYDGRPLPPEPPVSTYSFWQPSTPPGGSAAVSQAEYTFGLLFDLTARTRLDAVWFWSPPGVKDVPQRLLLWTAAQGFVTEMLNVVWSGPAGAGWIRAAFADPPTLDPGTYIAAAYGGGRVNPWYGYTENFWPQPAVTAGPLHIPAGRIAAVYESGLAFPTLTYQNQMVWIDVEVRDYRGE